MESPRDIIGFFFSKDIFLLHVFLIRNNSKGERKWCRYACVFRAIRRQQGSRKSIEIRNRQKGDRRRKRAGNVLINYSSKVHVSEPGGLIKTSAVAILCLAVDRLENPFYLHTRLNSYSPIIVTFCQRRSRLKRGGDREYSARRTSLF